MAGVHDGVAEGGEAHEQVRCVVGGRVAPGVVGLGVLVGAVATAAAAFSDVHAAELGAEDWGVGLVGAAGVCLCGWFFSVVALFLQGWDKDGAAGGGDCFDGFAAVGEDWGVGVVVESGQVRENVFPAAVVVDGPRRVESSAMIN